MSVSKFPLMIHEHGILERLKFGIDVYFYIDASGWSSGLTKANLELVHEG